MKAKRAVNGAKERNMSVSQKCKQASPRLLWFQNAEKMTGESRLNGNLVMRTSNSTVGNQALTEMTTQMQSVRENQTSTAEMQSELLSHCDGTGRDGIQAV